MIRQWRRNLGPVSVGVNVKRYPYPSGRRRWIIEPFVVFDREHGGVGTR